MSDGTVARPSSISGLGLFATRDFAVGERIAPYVGRRLTAPPAHPSPGHPTYVVELGPGVWLDGDAAENPARHANHSCDPNAELIQAEATEDLWLVASRPLASGTEITFDYGFSLAESLFHPCRCGAPACVGRIIAAPLRPALRRHLRFSRRRD
jgi:SET domain-containing protein